jgi:integrase
VPKTKSEGRILTPLPPRVRVKNGAYHYDCGRDEAGKRRWKKLCRIAEGEHALYKALAAVTSPRVRTLDALFDKYLGSESYLRLAPATQRDYAGYIRRTLRPWGGHCEPDEVRAGDVAQLLQRRLEGGSAVVANREAACLSTVYNFGMRAGECQTNPCKGVRRNPQPPRTRYVEHSELEAAMTCAPEAFQDFMMALYLTGLRQSELRTLKKSQVTAERITLREPKTGKLVVVEIGDRLRAVLLRACSRTPNSPYVFTNTQGDPWTVWAIQSQSRRLTGKTDWTLHDVRGKAETDSATGLGLLPLYRRARRIKSLE